ncbi:hypothetical protein QJS04_geneDACA024067 [Acorus gramineus]|uniref:Uncharacterized protein n=1 Tax=Acorus gramineus TaxID=55184 RepID=A0AAV9A372_ACOGR|nr:hypothetical protein QJS04_geneDACA024067 [Acorus gramineus]
MACIHKPKAFDPHQHNNQVNSRDYGGEASLTSTPQQGILYFLATHCDPVALLPRPES